MKKMEYIAFDGVGCALDDEYTLFGSLHDLSMVLEESKNA